MSTVAGLALAPGRNGNCRGTAENRVGDTPAKPGTATAAAAPGPARPQDEKAIRLAEEAFARAYNAGDAKAIAGQFVADGEVVSEEGQSTQGRRSDRADLCRDLQGASQDPY